MSIVGTTINLGYGWGEIFLDVPEQPDFMRVFRDAGKGAYVMRREYEDKIRAINEPTLNRAVLGVLWILFEAGIRTVVVPRADLSWKLEHGAHSCVALISAFVENKDLKLCDDGITDRLPPVDAAALARAQRFEVREASFVVLTHDGSIVTVNSANRDDTYHLPGGKADPGELPFMTANRELKEELGLDSPRLSLVDVRLATYGTDHTVWRESFFTHDLTDEEWISMCNYVNRGHIDNEVISTNTYPLSEYKRFLAVERRNGVYNAFSHVAMYAMGLM